MLDMRSSARDDLKDDVKDLHKVWLVLSIKFRLHKVGIGFGVIHVQIT